MEVKNPYKLIIENCSLSEVMLATAKAVEEKIEADGKALTDEQSLQVCQWTASKLLVLDVQHLVYCGGLIYLMLQTTDKQDRRGLLLSIADDLRITETKAYDSIAVFKCFGECLLETPELMQCFRMEPLKKLAAKQAPPAAREAAIELARKGERITIKRAEALLSEYGEPDERASSVAAPVEEVASTSQTSSCQEQSKSQTKQVWDYSGNVVRIVLEADESQPELDVSSIIWDLEAALDQYRREHGQDDGDSGTPEAA